MFNVNRQENKFLTRGTHGRCRIYFSFIVVFRLIGVLLVIKIKLDQIILQMINCLFFLYNRNQTKDKEIILIDIDSEIKSDQN